MKSTIAALALIALVACSSSSPMNGGSPDATQSIDAIGDTIDASEEFPDAELADAGAFPDAEPRDVGRFDECECANEGAEDCRGCFERINACCFEPPAPQYDITGVSAQCGITPACRSCCNECVAMACDQMRARGICPLR